MTTFTTLDNRSQLFFVFREKQKNLWNFGRNTRVKKWKITPAKLIEIILMPLFMALCYITQLKAIHSFHPNCDKAANLNSPQGFFNVPLESRKEIQIEWKQRRSSCAVHPLSVAAETRNKSPVTICARYTKHFKRTNGLVPVSVNSSIDAQCKRRKIHPRNIRGGGKIQTRFCSRFE